jgi:hypothetical protein
MTKSKEGISPEMKITVCKHTTHKPEHLCSYMKDGRNLGVTLRKIGILIDECELD